MKYVYGLKPRQHQIKALKFLLDREGVGALLMDPGTGKTAVVIHFCAIQAIKRDGLDVLVAAPLDALDTWVTEIEKHLGQIKDKEGNLKDIHTEILVLNSGSILEKQDIIRNLPEFDGLRFVIVNHDIVKYRHNVPGLKTVTVRDRVIEAIKDKWCPDLVVIDELHRLKTHSSNTSKAFSKICDSVFMRIGMTGTVAPHSPLDFFGQWKSINPRRFPKSWAEFSTYYAIWGGFEGRQLLGFYSDRLKEMKYLIKQDAIVIKKRDCLDLPKVTDIKVPVTLSQKELRYYKEMGQELIAELPSGKLSISKNTLSKILRLRQITGGVLGYTEEEVDPKTKQIKTIAHSEDIGNSKLTALMSKVEQIVGAREKQVIFAHFKRDVGRIEEACKKITYMDSRGNEVNVPVYTIHGGIKGTARKKMRQDFYNYKGPAIFVAQMRTVSLAVNELVVASYGHFYSISQLRDDFVQARDRLDRDGQKNPVTFYYYIVPHSIDEVILQAHLERGRLEAAVTKRAKEILTLKT